jgi:hypothetical protein
VDSVEMPRVTSAVVERQEGQVLVGLGEMGVAQMQQRIVGRVPWWDCWGANSMVLVLVLVFVMIVVVDPLTFDYISLLFCPHFIII